MASNLNFSPSQLKAITQRGSNILVSAGAGSGKTTVLTERISRLVKEGTPITNFLVLTFTEAAANEMKQRIRKEVTKTQGEEGALLVDQSHIETFDAFALWLVKKYSYALGISSDISIIDKGIMSIKEEETIREVIDEYLQNPDFFNLYTKYCFKNDKVIVKGIKSILSQANKQLDKEKFFDTYISDYYNPAYINNVINDVTKLAVDFFNEVSLTLTYIQDENEEGYLLEFFTPFFDVSDFDELRDLMINAGKMHRTVSKIQEDKDTHSYLKDKYEKEIEPYFLFGSRSEIINEYLSHKKEAELLVNMAREVERRLDEFKKKNGVYDFSDISFLANKLFRENQNIVSEVAGMFDYIFVDEYQDTNEIQEYVISRLGRDNVYMVGDIKQSIYRFRNADCEIFNEKFKRYKNGEDGVEVDLNNNFRSRPQVVEGVNRIFGYLMDPEDNPTTKIDYQQGHHFEEGEGQETFRQHEDENEYGFLFKEYPYDSNKKTNKEKEANLIADDIIGKVNSGFLVYDKKLDETRPCRYSDFAILCSTSTNFNKVQKVFNKRNIPLVLKADESSLDIIFARIIKNIVKLIYFSKIGKYDDDFRHAYMSISRSPIFEEKDQALYDKLKEKNPDILLNNIKDDALFKIVNEISSKSDELSLSEIMLLIYDKFDLTNCIFKLGSYEKNSLLWDQFVSNSLEMEKLGFTLKEYVDYFDTLDNLEISLDVPSIQNVDNAVTLSTIHKAKGLEYHIVYLPFLDGLIYGKAISEIPQIWASQTDGLIFPKMGIGMNESFLKRVAIQKEKDEIFNEKIRLLYVAMTRCMDETILILSHESGSADKRLNISGSKRYSHILRYLRDKGVIDVSPAEATNEVVHVQEKNYSKDEFSLKEFSYDFIEKPKHKASKELHINNPELLQYGTNVHYLMEHLDYESKDTSFIQDRRIKSDIDQILSMDIFKDVKNDNILHEYEFYDEENNVHGIIDCLILREDHIDIVDFKLKNIDDESYHHQLNTYRRYIEKVSNLPIHMYLLSIFDKMLEEVDYEDN